MKQLNIVGVTRGTVSHFTQYHGYYTLYKNKYFYLICFGEVGFNRAYS